MFSSSNSFKFAFVFCLLLLTSNAVSGRGKINLDYDGKADFLVFRPSNGTWYGYGSESGNNFAVRWGLSTDKAVPADYDGDGRTDVAVFRPETGVWYVLKSSNGQLLTATWGTAADDLVPADYDGDGQADFAVWRKSNNYFYVLTSSSGYHPRYFQVPMPTEIGPIAEDAVPADYDGDGKTDFAVQFLTSWYIFQSETSSVKRLSLICENGLLAPADYSGDGKAEPGCIHMQPDVLYRWRYLRSQDEQLRIFQWGAGFYDDSPVPDDYDNDGTTDIAVFRQGKWWIYPSSNAQPFVVNFGTGGDFPAQWANLRWNR